MLKDSDTHASEGASHSALYRRRLFVALLMMLGASIVVAIIVASRSGDVSAPLSTIDQLPDQDARITVTTIPTRTEVTSRLLNILEVRDRALLAREAQLLTDIYTNDCECLKDGRALIQQLRRQNIVWKGVRTSILIKSADEINDRLWIIVATVRTPAVRVETEAGQLVRTVPPEQNLVQFALAKPRDEGEWLLGHASSFE